MMMMIMMLQQNIRPKFDEKNRKVSIERNVFFSDSVCEFSNF